MVISHHETVGASFRTVGNLEEDERKEITETIQDAINAMETKDINTNEMKELTYNIWSECNGFVKPKNVFQENDKMEATIDKSRLPTDEKNAAHLQIGIGQDSTPIFVFVWFYKKLCIRKNLNIFTIPSD